MLKSSVHVYLEQLELEFGAGGRDAHCGIAIKISNMSDLDEKMKKRRRRRVLPSVSP